MINIGYNVNRQLILCAVLSQVLVFSLTGCGGSGNSAAVGASPVDGGTPPPPSSATGFFAPYTVASSDSAVYSSSALVLVNASDPSDQRVVSLPNAASFQWPLIVDRMTVAADGTTSSQQPYLMALHQSGHWYSVGLGQSLSQTPLQFSAESSSQPICLAGIHPTQRKTPGAAGIVYSMPGPDNQCLTVDDQLYTVQLSDSISTSPKSLTASGILDDSRDFFDASGNRLGSLHVISASLVWVDSTFSTSTVIGTSNDGAVPKILDSDSTQATVLLNNVLSHFDAKNATLGASLYSLPSGDQFGAAASDGVSLFFSVNSFGTSTGSSSTLLESIPLDGSASATSVFAPGLLSSPQGVAVGLAVTTSKVFVVLTDPLASGGTYTLAVTSKMAPTNKLNPSLTVVDTQQQGRMTITGVSGTSVYYNVPDSTSISGSGTAKVATEQGSDTPTYANSQWFGYEGNYSRSPTFDVLSEARNPDAFLLAAYGSPYAGSVAVSSIGADGKSTALGILAPTRNTSQHLSLKAGPGFSLGDDQTTADNDSYEDVYFLDASHSTLSLLTNTPDVIEAPVSDYAD